MTADKYVAFDVHKASILAVVRDSSGRVVAESVFTTEAEPVRDFLRGLSGRVALTFEEGTHATWLYDLTRPLVSSVLVCNPRRNRTGPKASKSDRIDGRRLSQWLYQGRLSPVFHDTEPVRRLKHLVRAYAQLVEESTRMRNRLGSLLRSNAIACPPAALASASGRARWIERLPDDGTRRRGQLTASALDALAPVLADARRALRAEVTGHPDYPLLASLPGFGPVRSAVVLACVVTPHRFRRDRQLWAYAGLAVVTRSSADHELGPDGLRPRRQPAHTRGLTADFNRPLKAAFKGAAQAAVRSEPFRAQYEYLLGRGLSEQIAKVVIARRLASVLLAIWKKKERFDASQLRYLTT